MISRLASCKEKPLRRSSSSAFEVTTAVSGRSKACATSAADTTGKRLCAKTWGLKYTRASSARAIVPWYWGKKSLLRLLKVCNSMQARSRSEEHTSELQSRPHLVCRLLLEKKKKKKQIICAQKTK